MKRLPVLTILILCVAVALGCSDKAPVFNTGGTDGDSDSDSDSDSDNDSDSDSDGDTDTDADTDTDVDTDTDTDTSPPLTDCEVEALTNPDMICCPDVLPGDCNPTSWSWSSEDQWYGCCTGDLGTAVYCGEDQGVYYEEADCDGEGDVCGYVASEDWLDCI